MTKECSSLVFAYMYLPDSQVVPSPPGIGIVPANMVANFVIFPDSFVYCNVLS